LISGNKALNIENPIGKQDAKPVESKILSKKSKSVSQNLLLSAYAFCEVISIFLSGLVVAHFYVAGYLGQADYYQSYITPLSLVPILAIAFFRGESLYDISTLYGSKRYMGKIFKTLVTVFGVLILLGFLIGITGVYSRVWFVGWAISSVISVISLRIGMSMVLKKLVSKDIPLSRVAIYGDTIPSYRAKTSIEAQADGTQIVGIFSDTEENPKSKNIAGNMEDLIELGKQIHIDQIIVAREVAERFDMTHLMAELSILPSEVLIYPNFLGEMMSVSGIKSLSNTRLIRVQKRPISEWGLLIKSFEDKILAAIALVLLSPLLLLTAIAIKLDSRGPVFFMQTRNGYNQKEIQVFKFRTMKVMENGAEFKQAEKNDARVTRIGSFLRKSSIDELPQLINVLKGEMSIVGPRPHPVALNFDYGARMMRYDNRHKVKPGITGWAQINGYRGPTDTPDKMRKRVEFDLEYIENWSLWFDLRIIILTPIYGVVGKNAF